MLASIANLKPKPTFVKLLQKRPVRSILWLQHDPHDVIYLFPTIHRFLIFLPVFQQ